MLAAVLAVAARALSRADRAVELTSGQRVALEPECGLAFARLAALCFSFYRTEFKLKAVTCPRFDESRELLALTHRLVTHEAVKRPRTSKFSQPSHVAACNT